MSKDRKSAHGTVLTASIAIFQFIAVIQIILLSLHVDVKERALVAVVEKNRRNGKNGGPDRTRTYDPRLIKAVL